ncbi:hypothetical protein PABG_01316 [Paracoccidioides brasiliensis Pb03]|nr:hypothetical protein PABG_01316 [Paracoccidioides brasiliensis Pb03]
MLPLLCTTNIILGVVSHLQLFKQGEWERHVPTLAATYAYAIGLLSPIVVLALAKLSVRDPLLLVSAFWISYMTGLFGSISLYRVFFHPLKAFPGPLGAKLSAWWTVKVSLPGYKLPIEINKLHKKHGDFVRIRPREISISHVDAIRDIHGPGTVCIKGPFYDINYPSRSLQMIRDNTAHARRRRLWDRGLGMKALSTYEPRIVDYCTELVSQLSARARNGKPIEITQWMDFFAFDVIGDVAFSNLFNMVKSGKPGDILITLAEAKPLLGILLSLPWTYILFRTLPIIRGLWAKRLKHSAGRLRERMKQTTTLHDLFTHLLNDNSPDSPFSSPPLIFDDFSIPRDLFFESELAIVAGSETTSSSLSALIYLLAICPEKQSLLQHELDGILTDAEDLSYQNLSANSSPFMDGCINEALRLYPAVPGNMQRMTPPEGAWIAGKWIPGDMLVSTPTYTMHRDPRNFKHPNSFIPERWLTPNSTSTSTSPTSATDASLILHKEAFHPFLIGAHSCAGKALAFMEMRLVTALLFRTFTVRLHSGEQAHKKPTSANGTGASRFSLFDEQEPGYRTYFTAKPPPFEVLLERRG